MVSAATLTKEIREILAENSDKLNDVTPRTVRVQLERRLGFATDELEPRKREIATVIKQVLGEMESGVKAEPAASFSSLSAPSAAAAASSSSRSTDSQRQLNATKKRELDRAAGSDSEDESASKKKRKTDSASGDSSSGSVSGDGSTIQLGGSKRVEVRMFKKMLLIDIRETYTDKTSGEERPGKKGISLKADQWEALLKNAGKINAAIARMQ